ncbi:hypothetical protein JE959_001657 [Aeromonas veronii]|nr:hypothetical protein [Aeromonas veronii]
MEIPMKKTKIHADVMTAFVSACGNCDDLNALLKGDLPAGMSNGESQTLKEWADDWSECLLCVSETVPEDEKEQVKWCGKKVSEALSKLTKTPVVASAFLKGAAISGGINWGDLFVFVPDADRGQAVFAFAFDKFEAEALFHRWVESLDGTPLEKIDNLTHWGESTNYCLKTSKNG